MQERPIKDGQSMFDVPLHAAGGRIADLRAERDTVVVKATGVPRRGLRYALGVRFLAMGAALVADDPILPPGRRLARG